ncbi:WD40/YVTN/BNR-like repeat-containing protein [Dyella terrae]|uniref:WD40/YVTN/BNR-like repeat-containing protein n=1 Tax=Dyella terrae TaxID=522259 RepID=UPI001EFE9195|nr:YCF48-related protein [Dyella terrae]ULU23487.1 Photosynthesis system II assembly factor YCF48 protein [Dyella terrae]
MVALRLCFAFAVACGLCACQAHDQSGQGASVSANAPTPAPSAYTYCKEDARAAECANLHDPLNPYEFSAVDAKRVDLPLQAGGHSAVATSLTGSHVAFNGIMVQPSGRLYAVGGPGLAIAAAPSDTATTWHVASYSEFADILNAITFLDDKLGFAVGGAGLILRTRDGGEHWESFNSTFASYKDPQRAALTFEGAAYAIAFADPTHGVVVGEQRILRSADAGQTWERVAQPLDGVALQRLQFTDKQHGWAVGSSGTVLRTDDVGAHWTAVSLGDSEVHLMGLSFSDAAHGCIGGGYKVWCTTDGGVHWEAAELAVPANVDTSERIAITQLLMRDAQQGWLLTRDGLIFHSSDAGRHWALWMDVVKASQGKLQGVELWGLSLGRERAWAAGAGAVASPRPDGSEAAMSLDSSPLLLSWPLQP